MTRLSVDMRIGDVLTIGTTTVRLDKKSGQLARLVIVADELTPIVTPKARREAAGEARKSALQPFMEPTHGEYSI